MSTKHILYTLCLGLAVSMANYAVSEEVHLTPEEEMALAEKLFSEEDIKGAAFRLRAAAEHNYLPAQVRMGEFMHGSDDDEEAFGWFLTAAYQGDAVGQYNLAQMYANGIGIEQNSEKGLYWLKKAAEQNNFLAVQVFASLYKGKLDKDTGNIVEVKNGFGIKPDKEQADIWGAKLPELEKIDARKRKADIAAMKKTQAEATTKLEQSAKAAN